MNNKNHIYIQKCEISGNLDNDDGIKNYNKYHKTVNEVMNLFQEVFGTQTMYKYPLLIDNALSGSGYVPIITPILGKYLIIKTGIEDGNYQGQIIFQLSHELTHLVFYSHLGLQKEKVDNPEESLCTAASLCALKLLCLENLSCQINHLKKSTNVGYKKGIQIAKDHCFSLMILKDTILKEIENRKYNLIEKP